MGEPTADGNEKCPNAAKHTEQPSGYMAWHYWAARMSRTPSAAPLSRLRSLRDLGAEVTAAYVPDHALPHCTACGDPRSAHAGLPRRHGAKCERCDCPGYTSATRPTIAAMTDLAAFLLARIAEDEALAKQIDDVGGWYVALYAEFGARPADDVFSAAIVRWDPARVLAECKAKRRIIEMHTPSPFNGPVHLLHDGQYGRVPACAVCVNFHADMDCENDRWPCMTLRLLALPYASHPDYQESWRPK